MMIGFDVAPEVGKLYPQVFLPLQQSAQRIEAVNQEPVAVVEVVLAQGVLEHPAVALQRGGPAAPEHRHSLASQVFLQTRLTNIRKDHQISSIESIKKVRYTINAIKAHPRNKISRHTETLLPRDEVQHSGEFTDY